MGSSSASVARCFWDGWNEDIDQYAHVSAAEFRPEGLLTKRHRLKLDHWCTDHYIDLMGYDLKPYICRLS
jgi:hypothetical protein